ncbi:hypothetical protein F8O53_04625 [Enterobacter sp. 63]
MKILALGGCGQEGKTAVTDMIRSDKVEQVIIGDIDITRANAVMEELASVKVTTLELDVNDREKLCAAMREVDVVANFVGPYYRYGLPILSAAIECGKHYVDICDDYDATSSLLSLNDKAVEAGITAIVGLGASPGVTNLMAKHAADQLDQVDDIEIKWVVTATDVEGLGESAALDHGLHMIDGCVPQYLNGAWIDAPATTESEVMTFPVVGETPIYYVGHPEPVTLPRYIKGVNNVTCKGGVPGLDSVLHAMAAIGLTSSRPVEIKGQAVSPRAMALKLFERLPLSEEQLPPAFSGFYTVAKGKKQGKPCEYAYIAHGRMSPWTGTPTSIGAIMLGSGEVAKHGVMAPEGCLDSVLFFAELAKRGLTVEKS